MSKVGNAIFDLKRLIRENVKHVHKIKRENEAAGDRTQDPQIKSLLLYQLSYGLKTSQE